MNSEKALERAIRRNTIHQLIKSIDSRLDFVARDIRHADSMGERSKLEAVQRELRCWKSELDTRLVRLKDDFNGGVL